MQMGNLLLERGHVVRIAYRGIPLLSLRRFLSCARSVKLAALGSAETRWLRSFNGETEVFQSLSDLQFDPREVVIATGEHTIGDLGSLQADVVKLRYCHGFLSRDPEHMRAAWGGRMATIAVSSRLVGSLEEYGQGPVLGIVPNGICKHEYFVEEKPRTGIGLVFSGHPLKGPEVAEGLVSALQAKFPATPWYTFGSYPKPAGLARCAYTRFPSIECARDLYNRCKVWLVTSRDEGFCLPILEAMACGCAVISSQHTNAADLIREGVNGFTVPYGDVSGYVDRVGRVLRDGVLRARIVQEGFKTVEQFSWDNAADKMEEVLQKLRVQPEGCPRVRETKGGRV